jgi:hypothetical protein
VPIWPVAVLVVAAIVAAIGMTVLRDAGQTTFVTSVTDLERLANSSASVREQGAVAPTISLANSGVAISHRGFAIPTIASVSHVAPSLHSTGYAGFENPGAYVTEAPALVPGLENPGAYPGEASTHAPSGEGRLGVLRGCLLLCHWPSLVRSRAPPRGDRGGSGQIVSSVAIGRSPVTDRGARHDIVVANAGAALYVAGLAGSIREGVVLAKDAIVNGAASAKLQQLVKESNA